MSAPLLEWREGNGAISPCYKYLVSEPKTEASDFHGPPTFRSLQRNTHPSWSYLLPQRTDGFPNIPEPNLFVGYNNNNKNQRKQAGRSTNNAVVASIVTFLSYAGAVCRFLSLRFPPADGADFPNPGAATLLGGGGVGATRKVICVKVGAPPRRISSRPSVKVPYRSHGERSALAPGVNLGT